MRIGLLSWETMHSISIGGVAVHVSELADALQLRGHEVHVFTRPAYGDGGVYLVKGVYYHYCKFDFHPDFIEEINNMCRSFVYHFFAAEDHFGMFDIVHAHDWLASNAAVWIKAGRGTRMVLTMHSTEYGRCGNRFYEGNSGRIRDHERNGIQSADKVITVSHKLKEEICWIYEVPSSKVTMIYNGIHPYRYNGRFAAEDIRQQIQIGQTDPFILFVGRLTEQKGPDILLHSIPRVLQHNAAAKFVFAGDGDQKEMCQAISRDQGLDASTRFLGHINGHFLKYLFKASDLVAVPSRNEPFGIVILEAWNAKKPVLVTKNGGPPEFVIDNVNGLYMDLNPESAAMGIIEILDDQEKATRMGSNGHKSLNMFKWDVIAEQTETVYNL
jgi:glycogen synthase